MINRQHQGLASDNACSRMHEPAILRPYILAERIGTAEAARRAGRSERTIREWCCLHRIGRRIGGRWAVSAVALDMLLNGDNSSLDAYLAGNRTLPAVVTYFERCGVPLT